MAMTRFIEIDPASPHVVMSTTFPSRLISLKSGDVGRESPQLYAIVEIHFTGTKSLPTGLPGGYDLRH
jgi:hypothetical protein